MTDSEKLILRTFEDEATNGLVHAFRRTAARLGLPLARVQEVVEAHTDTDPLLYLEAEAG